MNAIQLEKLTKYFGQLPAVSNLDLKVAKGEVFGFIGPNGAGKSTTIRMLLGLLKPTSGKAYLLGKDAISEGATIRQKIGYLPSEVNYYEQMKVNELLHYALSFYPRVDKKKLSYYLDLFQLDGEKKIKSLSLGNKKKTALIQALIHDPELLILDEPTGGLDPLMQEIFFNELLKEKERGKTIFFSIHILREVEKICDRFAIIRKGEIADIKDVPSLKKSMVKLVKITYSDPERVPSITDAAILNQEHRQGQTIFTVQGQINEALKKIIDYPFEDLRVESPSLEDLFMDYYKEEEVQS
jgi:ABC-2 type transport system ATP-binding protein